MKKVVLSLFLVLFVISSVQAANKEDVVKIVKKYSETVACTIAEVQYVPNQYFVLEVEPGDPQDNGDGSVHLVYWQGDTGCYGGSGTVRANYTVVTDDMGSARSTIVTHNYVDTGFGVTTLKELTMKDGFVIIKGTVPGETKWDQKPVSYKLQYELGELSLVK